MPIGEHAPPATTSVTTAELHAILVQLASARRFINSCARMNREDKIALYTKLREIDKIVSRNLQLSLFTPAQRSHG
jgi:hypothetical protein